MPNFFEDSACTPHGVYCQVCRMRHEPAHRAALLRRYGADGINRVDFDCPKGIPWDWKPVEAPKPVQRHSILDMMRSFTVAMLGGEYVAKDMQKERMKICSVCDRVKDGVCTMCGCGVGLEVKKIINLTSYVEKLDPVTTVTIMGAPVGRGLTWGCKHPKRKQGKGWPLT